jgi:pimeloyl-ACP methyl ester carboxylesterase
LVGFSWGTVLGLKMAQQYPNLLYAYVAVSQMVDQEKSEQLLLQRLKEQAATAKNQTALQELSLVRIPFENTDELYSQRKWLFHFTNNPVPDSVLKQYFSTYLIHCLSWGMRHLKLIFRKKFSLFNVLFISLWGGMIIKQITN